MSTSTAAESVSSHADPQIELHCPLCGYSLIGLPEPRCPECGYQFVWADLIEQQHLSQPWFFEHRGTLKTYFKTFGRSRLSHKFWSTVQPAWKISVGRLRRYQLASLVIIFLAGIASYCILLVPQFIQWTFTIWPLKPGVSFTGRSVRVNPFSSGTPLDFRVSFIQYYELKRPEVLLPALAMFITLLVTLPLFWNVLFMTTTRRQILGEQMKRVNAYTLDCLPLVAIAMVAYFYLSPSFYADVPRYVMLSSAVTLLLAAYRFWQAMRCYLRLPHSIGIAFSFLVICTLVWLNLLLLPFLIHMTRF